MKKLLCVVVIVFALVMLVTAFAFSYSLQALHINTASFLSPASDAVMSASDEAALQAAPAAPVRFEDVSERQTLCQKRLHGADTTEGF